MNSDDFWDLGKPLTRVPVFAPPVPTLTYPADSRPRRGPAPAPGVNGRRAKRKASKLARKKSRK